jgi:hypothetical protein
LPSPPDEMNQIIRKYIMSTMYHSQTWNPEQKIWGIHSNYMYLNFLEPCRRFRKGFSWFGSTWTTCQPQILPLLQMVALAYEGIVCIHAIPSVQLQVAWNGDTRVQFAHASKNRSCSLV